MGFIGNVVAAAADRIGVAGGLRTMGATSRAVAIVTVGPATMALWSVPAEIGVERPAARGRDDGERYGAEKILRKGGSGPGWSSSWVAESLCATAPYVMRLVLARNNTGTSSELLADTRAAIRANFS